MYCTVCWNDASWSSAVLVVGEYSCASSLLFPAYFSFSIFSGPCDSSCTHSKQQQQQQARTALLSVPTRCILVVSSCVCIFLHLHSGGGNVFPWHVLLGFKRSSASDPSAALVIRRDAYLSGLPTASVAFSCFSSCPSSSSSQQRFLSWCSRLQPLLSASLCFIVASELCNFSWWKTFSFLGIRECPGHQNYCTTNQ